MASARRLKQATYAGGCLGFLGIIVVTMIFVVAKPSFKAVPTPTPTPLYEPLVVEHVDSISHGDSIDIVAQIRNPNPRAGTGQYVVTFVLFDKDNREILRHDETVYILPGGLQYVTAIALHIPTDVSRIQVVMPSIENFMRLPEGQELPTFSSFLRERVTQVIATTQLEQQKGIVGNTSSITWERVEVTGVALDASGKIVGIGKTFVGELRAGQQREFTIQWPAPLTPTERVIVLPTTNIYSEDNILKVIGDPSLLR